MIEQNKLFIVLFFILILVFGLGLIGIYYILKFKRRQSEFNKEKAAMENRLQNLLLQARLEISEELLKNISQEIHDNIGQLLTLAKWTLSNEADSDNHRVKDAKELVTSAISGLRDLSHSLNGNIVLDLGLFRAVEKLCKTLNSSEELFCEVINDTPENIRLNPDKDLVLFRCIQEAVNNAIRHAKTSHIKIHFSIQERMLLTTVSDNGEGFEVLKNRSEGSGISNLYDRIAILRGSLILDSSPGQGTTLYFFVPIEKIVPAYA
jgi:signal transduction histidine kinase